MVGVGGVGEVVSRHLLPLTSSVTEGACVNCPGNAECEQATGGLHFSGNTLLPSSASISVTLSHHVTCFHMFISGHGHT